MITQSGIRLATDRDIDVLVDIHRQARDTYYRGAIPDETLDDPNWPAEARHAYTKTISSPERTLLCAEHNEEVVAFASLGPPFEPVIDADPATVAQLIGLYVRPHHWRQGIGTQLLTQSVQLWQANDIHTARLEVWDGNHRARTFYASHGWQPDGHRRPGPANTHFLRLLLTIPRD
ncbi:GNAT family N-acetyltransferase [Micromonospora sp. HNM0581]|uniref:GNAT family N-acetyltransferase n=1 Tax=Micromonospora sp. HNM0581 TaxID=2716341 RepID=UPI00146EACF9|nr:GNAT family N-acetyltransferase [Micromonospora sp. HNM0581]NLU77841.1 GNAT family N-acetyltransferase [Micromonospora sp. HNM0581]